MIHHKMPDYRYYAPEEDELVITDPDMWICSAITYFCDFLRNRSFICMPLSQVGQYVDVRKMQDPDWF